MIVLLIPISLTQASLAYSDQYTPTITTTPIDQLSAFLESTMDFVNNALSNLHLKLSLLKNTDPPPHFKAVLEEYDVEKIDTTQTLNSPRLGPLIRTTQAKIELAKQKKASCEFWYSREYELTMQDQLQRNSHNFKNCVSTFSKISSAAALQLSITIGEAHEIAKEDYQHYGAQGLFAPNEYSGPLQPCIRDMTDIYLAFEEFNTGNLNCLQENLKTKQGLRQVILERLCTYQTGTLSEKYNAFIGEGGILSKLTTLHNSCAEQENTQDLEWKAHIEQRKTDIEALRTQGGSLQKYCEITAADLALISDDLPTIPTTTIGGSDAQSTNPGDICAGINQNLNILSSETQILYLKTLPVTQRHSRILEFEERYRRTINLIESLGSFEKTVNIAKEKARLQKDSVSRITPDSDLEAEYEYHLQQCKGAYRDAADNPQKYFDSIHHSSHLLEIFSPTTEIDPEAEAAGLLARASKDFDTLEEQNLYDAAEKQKGKIQRSMYLAVAHGGHGVPGILPKAEQYYGQLAASRVLLHNLLLASGINSPKFEEFEQYFEGDTLNMDAAIGSLREMSDFYQEKTAEIEAAYRATPGEIYSAKLSATKPQIPRLIFANTNTPITYEFLVENPTSFQIDKASFQIPLNYAPKGIIAKGDIQSSLEVEAATEGKHLILEIFNIPSHTTEALKITIAAQLASAGALECEHDIQPELAKWECISKIKRNYDSLDGAHTLLIPFDKGLGSLLDPGYDQIKLINGAYFIETYSTDSWSGTFLWHNPLTISSDSTISLLNGFQVFTTLKIKNNLPLQAETTISHPLPYSSISAISHTGAELKNGQLIIPIFLPPNREKTITFDYLVTDREAYSYELLSEFHPTHPQFSTIANLHAGGQYDEAIALALSALRLNGPKPAPAQSKKQEAGQKLEEYRLLSNFHPEYANDYAKMKNLFQAGNTSLARNNHRDAEMKFRTILAFSYNRNTILKALEGEDSKMNARLTILSKIQRITNSKQLDAALSEMDTHYTTFCANKNTYTFTTALASRAAFLELDAKTNITLTKLLTTLSKNKTAYQKTLDTIGGNIPALRQGLTSTINSSYKKYSGEISQLEATITEEREILNNLQNLSTEEKILTLSALGKSDAQYNALKETLFGTKARLQMALEQSPGSTQAEAAYNDGRFLDGMTLLAHTTQQKQKTHYFLFAISILILIGAYLCRDRLFPKQESAITRIEKKIQLRNQ